MAVPTAARAAPSLDDAVRRVLLQPRATGFGERIWLKVSRAAEPPPAACACEIHLGRAGPLFVSAGPLAQVQLDPSAFHVLSGAPVPDRVAVPGLRLGRGEASLGLGLGAWTSTQPFAPARAWALLGISRAF